MEQQQQRHSFYANFGRLLYESFLFYASTNSQVAVLYHGMNIELLFKNLQCKFCAPTSTTTEEAVATSFGENGVVMKLESADSNSSYIKTIDMQLFTCFDNEAEHFIFESLLHINDIFVPRSSCWVGQGIMNRLSLFALLSNNAFVDDDQLLKESNQRGLIKILQCIANDTMATYSSYEYANRLILSLIARKDGVSFNRKNEQSLIPELTQLFVSEQSENNPFQVKYKDKARIICKLTNLAKLANLANLALSISDHPSNQSVVERQDNNVAGKYSSTVSTPKVLKQSSVRGKWVMLPDLDIPTKRGKGGNSPYYGSSVSSSFFRASSMIIQRTTSLAESVTHEQVVEYPPCQGDPFWEYYRTVKLTFISNLPS